MRDWIISLYRDGQHSQEAIAAIVGLSRPRVNQILTKARQNNPDIALCDHRRKCTANAGAQRRPMVVPASQMGTRERPGNIDYM